MRSLKNPRVYPGSINVLSAAPQRCPYCQKGLSDLCSKPLIMRGKWLALWSMPKLQSVDRMAQNLPGENLRHLASRPLPAQGR
jgi:hypothetical protein